MEDKANSTPGTLAKFHLGLAADGSSCALVFIDEEQNSIACIAGFADLDGFISSLTQAAREMARRRSESGPTETDAQPNGIDGGSRPPVGAIDVASANFRSCDEDGTIVGSLVGNAGQ